MARQASTVAGPGRLRHGMLAYETTAQFVDAAARFLAEGVAAGDTMLMITTADRHAAVRAKLPAVACVDFVEVHTWYQAPGEAMANCHEYLRDSPTDRALRLVGEPPLEGCSTAELAEWACYESAFNLAFAGIPMRVMCPYRTTHAPAWALAQARRTHPELFTTGAAAPSPDYVDPRAFAPAEEDPPPAPRTAPSVRLRVADRAAVARLATRQAFGAGMFGYHARTFALAVSEAAAALAGDADPQGRVRIWTEPRELICEITLPARRLPRITGYLPPPVDGIDDRGLWLARQLCRLVHLRTNAESMTARLHYPLRRES